MEKQGALLKVDQILNQSKVALEETLLPHFTKEKVEMILDSVERVKDTIRYANGTIERYEIGKRHKREYSD